MAAPAAAQASPSRAAGVQLRDRERRELDAFRGTGHGAGRRETAELTAGAWDDVLNPDVFKSFVATFEQANNAPDTGGAVRVVITVQGDGGAPLSNAHVTVADSQKTYLSASTGTDGRVLLIPSRDGSRTERELDRLVDRPGQDAFTRPLPSATRGRSPCPA